MPFEQPGKFDFRELLFASEVHNQQKYDIRVNARRHVVHHHPPSAGEMGLAEARRRGLHDIKEPEEKKAQRDVQNLRRHEEEGKLLSHDFVNDDVGGILPVEDFLRLPRDVHGEKSKEQDRHKMKGPGQARQGEVEHDPDE